MVEQKGFAERGTVPDIMLTLHEGLEGASTKRGSILVKGPIHPSIVTPSEAGRPPF